MMTPENLMRPTTPTSPGEIPARTLSYNEDSPPSRLQQILGALELFHSRLYSIEVLRRSTARLNLAGIEPLRT